MDGAVPPVDFSAGGVAEAFAGRSMDVDLRIIEGVRTLSHDRVLDKGALGYLIREEKAEETMDTHFREMVLITYGMLVWACWGGQRWQFSTALPGELQGRHLTVNMITYSLAIGMSEKTREWQIVCAWFQEMQNIRLFPAVISYKAATSNCEKDHQRY